jgi:NitT/TauT family transport system substrate-binding protein
LRYRYVLLLLLLVLPLGCRSPRPTSRLVIGVRTANDHAPFYIADRQQLYHQHGLAVTVRLVASNTAIIEGLQRGDFQMGAVPVTTAIAAIAQGSPLHIVAMTGRGSDGLLVRAEGGIASLADLRGQKIATIRASILDVLLRQALEQSGLNPDRDVELVYMSTLGDMIAALKTGQVAATSNTEPFLTDAERQGWGRILTYYTVFWPEHPCCVVVARDDLAQDDPRALREVLAIHCAAVTWANAHPAETAQIIVDTLQAYDATLVQESLSRARMHIDYQIAPEEIERMAALMAAQGLIERVPSRASLLSLGPLADALNQRP